MPDDSVLGTTAEVTRAAAATKAATMLAADETLRTAGQRRVNLIWESTQSIVAVSVTLTTFYVLATLALRAPDLSSLVPYLIALCNLSFLVLGFYFGRTNHQKQGGVQASDTGR
jgi:hypothetical protein